MPFQNRTEAGKQLAAHLQKELHLGCATPDTVVVTIPRGGVLVARAVAFTLQLPMDVLLVHRLNVRGLGQFEAGTVAEGVMQVLDQETLQWFQLSGRMDQEEHQRELREIKHHNQVYHHHRPVLRLSGKTVILVDECMVTGITMQAAVQTVKFLGAKWVVVAVPHSSLAAVNRSRAWSAAVVCLLIEDPFVATDGYLYPEEPTDVDIQHLLEVNTMVR